jgi:hypothetical protein
MKSTLIVATLLAAALISAGTLPASAKGNNGAFGQSAEGNRPNTNVCEGYRTSFLDFMHAATTAGDDSSRKWYNDSAIEYWQEAKAIGCGWVNSNAVKGPWIGKMT